VVPRPEFETGRNDRLTRQSLHWIAADPLRQLRLVPQRTFWTFKDDHDALGAVPVLRRRSVHPVQNGKLAG